MNNPTPTNKDITKIKFKNKYRTTSHRLKEYDYTSEGAYFITICCQNKECMFGDIVDEKMVLNDLGKRVKKSIFMIDEKHDFIILDEFVVMPNHIHVILFIIPVETRHWRVSTKTNNKSKFGNLPKKSISSVINHFKGFTTKYARNHTDVFTVWQSNYYDRIVRNEDELNRIREYIIRNPEKWEEDRNNTENIFM